MIRYLCALVFSVVIHNTIFPMHHHNISSKKFLHYIEKHYKKSIDLDNMYTIDLSNEAWFSETLPCFAENYLSYFALRYKDHNNKPSVIVYSTEGSPQSWTLLQNYYRFTSQFHIIHEESIRIDAQTYQLLINIDKNYLIVREAKKVIVAPLGEIQDKNEPIVDDNSFF